MAVGDDRVKKREERERQAMETVTRRKRDVKEHEMKGEVGGWRERGKSYKC